MLQHAKFGAREFEWGTAKRGAASTDVHPQGADEKAVGALRALRVVANGRCPSQDRADSCSQFPRIERLGQVIVGTELEAQDAIDGLAAGGQHQYR